MIAFLSKLLKPATSEFEIKQHYATLVEQSRDATLYEQCGLPDTIDGRYEAIILHLFIAERNASNDEASMMYIRNLHEAFVQDMDRGLREGGVGDTGIGKRIKRMAAGLFGRLEAYRNSIDDAALFKEALLRNAYSTCDAPPTQAQVDALATYVQAHIATS